MPQRRFDSDSEDGGASSDDAWQPSRGPTRMGARTEPQCECFCDELLALLWDACGICIVPVVAERRLLIRAPCRSRAALPYDSGALQRTLLV